MGIFTEQPKVGFIIMHIAEIWLYPVKSLAGTRVTSSEISSLGVARDREIVVVRNDEILTARRYPKLLGLRGNLSVENVPTVNGYRWDSAEALALVRNAVGGPASLVQVPGSERFDVLPLLVATDGAIAQLGVDARRLRPNIIIGDVPGLEERTWPGKQILIGSVVIEAAQLRGRCVMTTYDPDTQVQDLNVLRQIVKKFAGTMALDCSVSTPGSIHVGDTVEIR
jgi:uncharacterized protein YcbX